MRTYDLALDLYPLLTNFPQEGAVLAEHVRDTLIMLVTSPSPRKLRQLRFLLMLCYDLGYVEKDIYEFCQKRLDPI